MSTNNNCNSCPEFNKSCDGKDNKCMCRICPRKLGKCLITRYCRETESVLN